jgi:hypothetical protein
VAVWSAPDKKPDARITPASKAANDHFWETLHGGRYEELPKVIDALTAVYLDNPNDSVTAAHLGFAHIWRVSERSRDPHVSPGVTDHIVLARKYFTEAVRLDPDDARYAGFLAAAELAEGKVHRDEKLTRRGYFNMMAAKKAFPEFNLFTAGYLLSELPVTDTKFRDAVEYQWQTVDLVAEEKYDRRTVSLEKYLHKETTTGPKRVLWNSWIAPHNWEGFFLNMGDMLVKQGDTAAARAVYANARLSRTYHEWPYRDVLETRIAQADENVELFRRETPNGDPIRDLMFRTRFACTGCHQAR